MEPARNARETDPPNRGSTRMDVLVFAAATVFQNSRKISRGICAKCNADATHQKHPLRLFCPVDPESSQLDRSRNEER
jgi:hypothetical protein